MPRMHTIETVVREHGLDLGGKMVRLEGLAVVDVAGAPAAGTEQAELIDVIADGRPLGKSATPEAEK